MNKTLRRSINGDDDDDDDDDDGGFVLVESILVKQIIFWPHQSKQIHLLLPVNALPSTVQPSTPFVFVEF